MNFLRTTKPCAKPFLLFLFLLLTGLSNAQMITGVWHGKMARQNAELKIIKSGDSLTGTSYYYSSVGTYCRYSIRGYFDERTNQAVWWDDQLIEEKEGGLLRTPGKTPLLSRADFNCPGGGVMLLDGSSNEKNEELKDGTLHLEKTGKAPHFRDEWDWVIDNFLSGTNDPDVIDSVSLVAFREKTEPLPQKPPTAKTPKPGMAMIPAQRKESHPEPEKTTVASTPKSIEEKFTGRKKKVFTTIPAEGDSIALSFYDNAIVDGDSVSLFLDGEMLFTHIKLSDKPYSFKLATADLKSQSELTMVAENLGSIPPNTAYMLVLVGNKRFTANLASTEESSAVIRFSGAKSQ